MNINYIVLLNVLEPSARRGHNSVVVQRNKYRNRIAFLIATKRKTLKRLALKRVARTSQRRMKSKYQPANKRQAPARSTRKPVYDKKIRRLSGVSSVFLLYYLYRTIF